MRSSILLNKLQLTTVTINFQIINKLMINKIKHEICIHEHTKKEGKSLWRKIVYLGAISNFVTKPSKGEI